MSTYLISVNYSETGSFTLEQLAELAKERKFTWDHYILKMGESKWYRAWEIKEIKSVLEKNFVLKSGDTGPSGGMVFFYDEGEKRNVMEAVSYDLGPVQRRDAEKVCEECRDGGVKDWRLPDADEMRSFAVAKYHAPAKGGSRAYENRTVLHWCSLKKDGKCFSVCTQEYLDTYNPWAQRPASSKGPYLGNPVESDEGEYLPVRAVRLIKTIPKPEQVYVEKGYGSRAEPPV
jgi:hypothetical protein